MKKQLFHFSLLPALTVVPTALITACANQTSTALNSGPIDDSIKQAKANLVNLLDFLNKNVKPSEVELSNLKRLFEKNPAANYSFSTTIEDDVQTNSGLAYDDEKGERYLQINLKRGSEQEIFNYTIKGLISNQEAQNDQKLGLDNYFGPGLDILTLIPKFDTNRIENSLSQAKLQELIDFEPNANTDWSKNNTLLKTKLQSDHQLIISNIRPFEFYGVTFGVAAQAQIASKSNPQIKSHKINFWINGFDGVTTLTQESLMTQTKNINFFNPGSTSDRLEKPSTYQTTEELAKLLIFGGKGTTPVFMRDEPRFAFELLELVPNSADDQKGSLKARFKFAWVEKSEVNLTTVLTLYGFKAQA